MKFGPSCNITNWNHNPHTEVAGEVHDIAVHRDEAGWDLICFTEHLRRLPNSVLLLMSPQHNPSPADCCGRSGGVAGNKKEMI